VSSFVVAFVTDGVSITELTVILTAATLLSATPSLLCRKSYRRHDNGGGRVDANEPLALSVTVPWTGLATRIAVNGLPL